MVEQGSILFESKNTNEGSVAGTASIKTLQKMMESVVTDGTASRLMGYEIPFNLIGKTGTTQNNGDGWFIGCSPELVIGAWVGTYDKRVQFSNTRMGSGANTALPIVGSIFKNLSYWKRPILTNFQYDFDYFPCPPFSEFNATEAYLTAQSDSTYLEKLRLRDSIESLIDTAIQIDSIPTIAPVPLQLDSLKNESIIKGIKESLEPDEN